MSNLSRQDFEAIASAIRRVDLSPKQRECLVDLMSPHFERRSPKYDRNRFFQACLPRIGENDDH